MPEVQAQAGLVRSPVSPLPVLVQLPELRAQGALDQHVDLPPLRYQSALTKKSVAGFWLLVTG